MTISDFFSRYSSDCSAGSANQLLARFPAAVTQEGRVSYRLSHGGENFALLFSNRVDSTFADGEISRAGDPGGEFEILSLRVGLAKKAGEEPDAWRDVTFGGVRTRTVKAGEGLFCTDPIPLGAAAGDHLRYDIVVRGECFPYHEEITLKVVSREVGGSFAPDKRIPVPLMIGSDRPVSLRIGFLGDSITQGCGTDEDSYDHWAAKIEEGLPDNISVWDLGIGYARAYDAASDGLWLERAKTCDAVSVCFGVNDLFHDRTVEEIEGDLRCIMAALSSAGCRVILFTVPPFDFEGILLERWRQVNAAIRGSLGREADAVFDFAAVLGHSEPEQHLAVYGGHPNAEGCAVLAKEFLGQLPKLLNGMLR